MEGVASGGVGVSDKDIDYKNAVLYFSDKSAVSLELRAALEEFPEVHIQNVKDLAERPPWLTGVPTLVTLPGLEVYRGTGAVRRAEEWARSRVRPMPPPSERCTRTWDVAGAWGAAQPDAREAAIKERTLEELLKMRSLTHPDSSTTPAAASALAAVQE